MQTSELQKFLSIINDSSEIQPSLKLLLERGYGKLDVFFYHLKESDPNCPVGVALIICNKFSSKTKPRLIAEAEMVDLVKTFETLNYHVTTLPGPNYPTILTKLEKVVELVHEDHSNFVCCICSYGGRDEQNGKEYIVDTNGGRIYLEETVGRIFSSCEALRDKPKMFFIQACRGPQSDQLQKSLNNPGAAAAAVYNA